jgi:hypothetical protein
MNRLAAEELYCSVDIETDGPCPGLNSMLSLAVAAFDNEKVLQGQFTVNIKALPEATQDKDTMEEFWSKFPEQWKETQYNAVEPGEAMTLLHNWLVGLKKQGYKLVFVGFPASFDFTFVHYYLCRFVGQNIFGYKALDIKSYAMGVLGSTFGKAGKSDFPDEWIPSAPHTHVALDDAIEQGLLFCNILAARAEK